MLVFTLTLCNNAVMKIQTYLIAALFSTLSTTFVLAGEVESSALPVCSNQHDVYPCLKATTEAGFDFVDMMIENIEGVKMIHKGGKEGLHVGPHLGTVTVLSSQALSNERRSPIVEVTKFEMNLTDHGGGDIDYPGKKWTVIKTTTFYGYVNESKYENFLEAKK